MMCPEEIYYRRAYKLLERIIETYKNGYDKEKVKEFWCKEFLYAKNNFKVIRTEQSCLSTTISIALMGINKEKLETIGKIKNYNNSLVYADIRNEKLDSQLQSRIEEFESYKTQNTMFDNWLSLIKSPDSDQTSLDLLKRVRNGLLHSNFIIDNSNNTIMFTHIKTKSYYESVILNPNFEQFIFAYFSNLPTMGIPEKTFNFVINKDIIITDKKTLKDYLKQVYIMIFKYNVDEYLGTNTLDYVLHETTKGNEIDFKETLKKAAEKGINIEDIEFFPLNPSHIDEIINYFETTFGPDFYKLPHDEIREYVIALLEYKYDSKRIISNWLMHYYHLINRLTTLNFDINSEAFKGDNYATIASYPTLLILKAYLIMYRLQNNAFNSINFEKVEFDFDDDEYKIYSEDINNPESDSNYYIESYLKQQAKYPELQADIIQKQIICEIIRNSLAHGNITSQLTEKFIPYIELKDIDKKTGKVRGLLLTIDKFELLLKSKAFEPKNCYQKDQEKQLKNTMSSIR